MQEDDPLVGDAGSGVRVVSELSAAKWHANRILLRSLRGTPFLKRAAFEKWGDRANCLLRAGRTERGQCIVGCGEDAELIYAIRVGVAVELR